MKKTWKKSKALYLTIIIGLIVISSIDHFSDNGDDLQIVIENTTQEQEITVLANLTP